MYLLLWNCNNNKNIYWINIHKVIKNYIENCKTCNKVKKFQKNEKQLSTTILSKGPLDRYVIDLWHLPPELLKMLYIELNYIKNYYI